MLPFSRRWRSSSFWMDRSWYQIHHIARLLVGHLMSPSVKTWLLLHGKLPMGPCRARMPNGIYGPGHSKQKQAVLPMTWTSNRGKLEKVWKSVVGHQISVNIQQNDGRSKWEGQGDWDLIRTCLFCVLHMLVHVSINVPCQSRSDIWCVCVCDCTTRAITRRGRSCLAAAGLQSPVVQSLLWKNSRRTLCRFSPVAHATISVGFRDRLPWKWCGIAA